MQHKKMAKKNSKQSNKEDKELCFYPEVSSALLRPLPPFRSSSCDVLCKNNVSGLSAPPPPPLLQAEKHRSVAV